MNSTTKDNFTFKYVHNKKETLRCNSKDVYENYLANGWLPGRHYSAWNRGLTKETDERVLKYSSNTVNKKKSKETREKISKLLKGRKIPKEQIERRIQTRKITKPSQTEETKRKISEALKGHPVSKTSIEKRKQTLIFRYGSLEDVPHYKPSEEDKKRSSNYHKSKEFQDLQRKKKLLNGTMNTSKPEEDVYSKLKERFGEDVVRYYTDERYPFECDFYIKSRDLFIECNFHWTHGLHPFNNNDLEDIKKLKDIKKKQKYYINNKGKEKKNMYFVFEDVWTKRDPLKLKTAKINSLNYRVFYSFSEFNIWFEGSASDLGTYYHNNFKK